MDTPQYTPKQVARFWSKIDIQTSDECWEWTRYKDKDGYGQTSLNHKGLFAHRVSWILTYGSIQDNLFVCHDCDNPSCCNPSHLFLGTTQQNTEDKIRKSREARGEKVPQHKLTSSQVSYIRNRYAQGDISFRKLAKEMGVGNTQIVRIIKRENWKHI